MLKIVNLIRCHSAAAAIAAVSAAVLIGATPAGPRLDIGRPGVAVPESYFGMHIHGIDVPRPETGRPTPWPSVRFGAWRLHDAYVRWSDLEPRRGEFEFSRLDRYSDLAARNHVRLLLPLFGTPAWASLRPGEKTAALSRGAAAPPADIQDWRDFVHVIADRYRGRIEAYEIWNEPNLREFWTGSVADLTALSREAYKIIKSVDPAATVVLPSATTESGPAFLESFLAAGGAAYGDIVGYHFYVHARPPEAMAALAVQIRRILQAHGVDKPVWNTEAGWDVPKPFSSEETASAYVARSLVLMWAAGVSRFYWYAWDNHAWVSLQMTKDDNSSLTAAARAYAATRNWMAGKVVRSCRADSSDNYVCQLDAAGGNREWIVWNAASGGAFHIPAEWHATRVSTISGARRTAGSTIQAGASPILIGAE